MVQRVPVQICPSSIIVEGQKFKKGKNPQVHPGS